jgi:hypothetical protein
VSPDVLGPVPDTDLPSLVAAAGAFAFPSTREGFGLAAMEALAAGVPVVASDLPVLREVLGGAACFAAGPEDFATGLRRALDHPDPARRTAGQQVAARYTWAAAAARHLRFYRDLLAGRAGASAGGDSTGHHGLRWRRSLFLPGESAALVVSGDGQPVIATHARGQRR